jgi:hypothetical protein
MDQPTRELIAYSYALAMTDANGFFKVVQEHPTWYARGGKWDKGVRRLGRALTEAGIRAIPGSDLRESAYDIAGRVGRPDLGESVYSEMSKTSGELLRLGSLLQAMPGIIEGILRGDRTAYDQSLFAWGAVAIEAASQTMLPRDGQAFKKICYELNAWMMLQYAQQI